MNTKERIIKEALYLFAEKGYGAVSVAEIAKAVGIKAPSLYKHYKSKQDIFDAILVEMSKRYDKQAASMQMHGTNANMDVSLFTNIDENMLLELGKSLFLYFLHDEYVCQFRKMLTIEQYHNQDLSKLYTKQYHDDPISYQEMMFTLLGKDKGSSEQTNIMALQFYAPIFILLTLCDRDPSREEEALLMIEKHIKQFNCLYRKVL
ncbi:MAG: TetR/AcrR family transcriptional regulator [Coprobacillaceae bacterium]